MLCCFIFHVRSNSDRSYTCPANSYDSETVNDSFDIGMRREGEGWTKVPRPSSVDVSMWYAK